MKHISDIYSKSAVEVHQILTSLCGYVHLNLNEPLSNIDMTKCQYWKGKINSNVFEHSMFLQKKQVVNVQVRK